MILISKLVYLALMEIKIMTHKMIDSMVDHSFVGFIYIHKMMEKGLEGRKATYANGTFLTKLYGQMSFFIYLFSTFNRISCYILLFFFIFDGK